MVSFVEDRIEEVGRVCRRYGVEQLDIFGSAVGDDFDPERSDLDFVVSFEPRNPPGLFDRYFGLKEDLEELFGRPIDLVMEGVVSRNAYFAKSLAETRIPLYAA
ncbi:MAG: nucleotidyltransferase domain-containing protein [Rubrobacter sp.]